MITQHEFVAIARDLVPQVELICPNVAILRLQWPWTAMSENISYLPHTGPILSAQQKLQAENTSSV